MLLRDSAHRVPKRALSSCLPSQLGSEVPVPDFLLMPDASDDETFDNFRVKLLNVTEPIGKHFIEEAKKVIPIAVVECNDELLKKIAALAYKTSDDNRVSRILQRNMEAILVEVLMMQTKKRSRNETRSRRHSAFSLKG